MGVKQGWPLSPTVVELYVLDGLEKCALNTPGIDASRLIATLIHLLLYADDLISCLPLQQDCRDSWLHVLASVLNAYS